MFSVCVNSSGSECGGGYLDEVCAWDCREYFCYGAGTDMLMGGFQMMSPETPCVILLFQNWVLDSRLKFGLAGLGVFLMGLSIEAVIALRRMISKKIQVFGEV